MVQIYRFGWNPFLFETCATTLEILLGRTNYRFGKIVKLDVLYQLSKFSVFPQERKKRRQILSFQSDVPQERSEIELVGASWKLGQGTESTESFPVPFRKEVERGEIDRNKESEASDCLSDPQEEESRIGIQESWLDKELKDSESEAKSGLVTQSALVSLTFALSPSYQASLGDESRIRNPLLLLLPKSESLQLLVRPSHKEENQLMSSSFHRFP